MVARVMIVEVSLEEVIPIVEKQLGAEHADVMIYVVRVGIRNKDSLDFISLMSLACIQNLICSIA